MSLVELAAPKPRLMPRVVIMGEPGVGKTSLARDLGAVILAVEAGSQYLNPPAPTLSCNPQTGALDDFAWVIHYLDLLAEEDHPWGAVAVDTLDALEKVIWRQVCRDNGMENIEGLSPDFNKMKATSYGKGYVAALNLWHQVTVRLDRLRTEKNMLVLLLAHAKPVSIMDQDLEKLENWDLDMHAKAAKTLRGWADACWFASFERRAVTTKDAMGKEGARIPTRVAPARVLHCGDKASAATKCRFEMPATVPMVPGSGPLKEALGAALFGAPAAPAPAPPKPAARRAKPAAHTAPAAEPTAPEAGAENGE